MVDVAAASEATQALPAVVGALGAGGGVVWLARTLFSRMIKQYDERHLEQAKKLDKVAEKFEQAIERLGAALAEVKTKVAVTEHMLGDTKTIRTEVQASVVGMQQSHANLKAAVQTELKAVKGDVEDLRGDVWVAHRRLELVAKGDTDIGSVTKPSSKRRPT